MGSGSDWNGVVSALEEKFYCVVVDLPGHGLSLRLPSETYTVEGAARELLTLISGLHTNSPILVGYSMGGRLALHLALRHPEQCRALFLESASPGLEDAADQNARRRADEEKARRLESGDFEEFLKDWYEQPVFTSLARNKELLRQTFESRLSNVPEELAKSLRGMGTGSQTPLWQELDGLSVPTLAVAGELDGKFVQIGRRMEAESRMVRFVRMPGASHKLHAESTGGYIRLLQDFAESI